MRDLKFKAFYKNEMHIVGVGLAHTGEVVRIGDCIILQNTGLRDSKRTEEYPEGQEIYEGDLIKSIHPDKCHIVIFDEETAMFGFYKKSIYGQSFEALYRHEKEVIGNIHENPELLK